MTFPVTSIQCPTCGSVHEPSRFPHGFCAPGYVPEREVVEMRKLLQRILDTADSWHWTRETPLIREIRAVLREKARTP